MSKGVNKVILIGNLGQDPVIKQFSNGDSVANITIATSESWKDKSSGENKEKTEWHTVVFYRRLAEVVGKYLKKGSKVYIEGKLATRSWEDDGVKHWKTEIIADKMQMLDSKGSNDDYASNAMATKGKQQAQTKQAQTAPAAISFDDDIPF